MANALYNLYKNAAMTTGAPNLVSDTIKAMLVTSAYVPNLNTDQYASTPATNPGVSQDNATCSAFNKPFATEAVRFLTALDLSGACSVSSLEDLANGMGCEF